MLTKLFNLQPFAANWARAILKMDKEVAIVWDQTAYSCDWLEMLMREGKR